MNLRKFYSGKAFDAYEYFGAHLENGGVIFRTYAPNAQGVNLIGEFTGWKEEPMHRVADKGVWVYFSPYARTGQMYKYCIYRKMGRQEHSDPYGYGMELRPGNCSIIRDLNFYVFTDQKWMRKRTKCYDKAMNIYEMHFGSWMMKEKRWWHTYDEIADELIAFLIEHNYNYVEFLPLTEHPFDGSWGYQNIGYFAPTSRYGTCDQFKHLINKLHHAEIGVIMDFVPVHFAVDGHGLRNYDGSALYEYPDKKREKSEWGSCHFNHARSEVQSFLQSAANFWLKEYHVDGLRIDAVSRLIYWRGDGNNGENLDGIQFLKALNQGLHKLNPKAILIAEDSTIYPGITKPVKEGGLGFDYKWDLGWTNDTLEYMRTHPHNREGMPEKITFSMYYAKNERYIMPFSHDESARGRKTIIDKIWGNDEEKFAQARVLYMYMMTHPGKKLSFMGNELATFREWRENRELDWELLQSPKHKAFLDYITELNRIYLKKKANWESDYNYEGFQWIENYCNSSAVFTYMRTGKKDKVFVALNFSDKRVTIYPHINGKMSLLLHSDLEQFGGKTKKCKKRVFENVIPAFSGVIYEVKEE